MSYIHGCQRGFVHPKHQGESLSEVKAPKENGQGLANNHQSWWAPNSIQILETRKKKICVCCIWNFMNSNIIIYFFNSVEFRSGLLTDNNRSYAASISV